MLSAAKATLRPGLRLGAYPEDRAADNGWLDVLFARVSGFIGARLKWQDRRLQAFLRDVERAGESLSGLDEEDFRRRIDAIRQVLRRDGLSGRHLAMAFAIVREAGSRTLGMRLYAVQIMAGRVLLDGKLAEMETGEGKTLMATLPASVAALAGIPVHVITVNDYLVARDAEQMSPLYNYLGLTVGMINEADGRG